MKFPKWTLCATAVLLLVVGIGCGKQMSAPALAKSDTTAAASPAQTATQSAPFAKPSPIASAGNGASEQAAPEPLVIPSGTAITVRLLSTVSSATSQPGDRFDATLDQPIVIDGKAVAPEGTQVTGRVIAARRSGRLLHPGYLRIALASLTLDGKDVPVQSTSVIVAGTSHKRRNLAWIGGGAGGGALIGAIASGGTGALIGSAIGAAGGTTTAFVTGKKDVGFAAERRLTFRLTREVNAG
jgi:hypothetical protein